MALPTAKGERLTEGLLYRFIPNWRTLWDYDLDRPSPRAFRRRSGEQYVSMYLDGLTGVQQLEALRPTFGICAVRVEDLLRGPVQDPLIEVVYEPDEEQPEGRAHVAVYGINRRRAEWLAREIAQCIRPPGAPVDHQDEPQGD